MTVEEKRKYYREYMREYRKKYPERGKERGRIYSSKYRKKHPEKIKESRRENYRKNKDKILDKNRRTRHNLRKQVIEMMGNECVICGFDDFRALQIDHINEGGSRERKKLTQQGIYRKIRDSPHLIGVEYQLLCANHNQIKKQEKREYRLSVLRNE